MSCKSAAFIIGNNRYVFSVLVSEHTTLMPFEDADVNVPSYSSTSTTDSSEIFQQIKKGHSDGNEAKATCMLEASVNGSVYKASGTVQTAVPVLLELNGSAFRQPVSLSGNLLFFRAAASPQLLPSVSGKLTDIRRITLASS